MRAWLFAIACTLMSSTLAAHQLKAAITTVLVNERTGNLELMHRFYLHDTEHAVEKLLGGHADILKNESDQLRFAQYVSERIALKTPKDKMLGLNLIGAEVDGKFFWVYQETKIPTPLVKLAMKHSALRDVWSEQVNMVNFEGLNKVHTLHFDGDDEWLEVTF